MRVLLFVPVVGQYAEEMAGPRAPESQPRWPGGRFADGAGLLGLAPDAGLLRRSRGLDLFRQRPGTMAFMLTHAGTGERAVEKM